MTILQKVPTVSVLLCVLGLTLAGCGGSGSSSGNSGTPAPDSPVYAPLAKSAQLNSVVDLSANTVTISWKDTFPAGTTYRIQTMNADGSNVTTVSTQPALGSNTTFTYRQGVTVSQWFRVIAQAPDNQSYTMLSSQNNPAVAAPAPAVPPAIQTDPAATPLTGTVTLSVSGDVTYPSVNWYLDTNALGTGTGTGGRYDWNTTTVGNGPHLILAYLNTGSNTTAPSESTIVIRQQVTVTNSNLAVSASASGTTGTIAVTASASSNYGITSVAASLDGQPYGTLTAPNANGRYQFTLNSSVIGSGTHTMLITATDGAGGSKTTTVTINVSNPPQLTLTTPQEGTFVNGAGTLNISGTMSSDKSGAVTVSAYLGSLPVPGIRYPASGSFSGAFDLSGFNPGTYTLTVKATDSGNVSTTAQVSLIITSSALTAYTPLLAIGPGGSLLAVDGSYILYRSEDSSCHLYNTATGSDITLADTVSTYTNWKMSGGYSYGQGNTGGVYMWDPTGRKTSLSANDPNRVTGTPMHPVPHGSYVIWDNWITYNSGSYSLYNTATGSYTLIGTPGGVSYLGNWNYDFALTGGDLVFFYWAKTGSGFDIFRWTLSERTSTRITSDGLRNTYPQVDSQRVAWQQTPASSTGTETSSLLTLPVSGTGTATTVSTSVLRFRLADGVLAWTETGSGSTSALLKASVASGGATVISTASSTVLYDVGGGHVVYGALGKVYSYQPATGANALLVDAAPRQIMTTGGKMYFLMGQYVYLALL